MLRTLTRKVTLGVVVFVVVLLLVAANAVNSVLAATAFSSYLTDHTLAFTRVSGLLLVHTARAMTEVETFVRTRDTDERDEALDAIQTAQNQLNRLRELAARNDLQARERAEHTALLDRWQSLLDQSTQHIQSVIAAVERDDLASITATFEQIEELEEEFVLLEAETEALLEREANDASASMADQNQRRLIAVPLGFGLLGLVALLTVWLLRRFIVRPIAWLSQAARTVAQGDLSQQVAVNSSDEIGDLQRTFNQMITNLRAQQAELEQHNAELLQSMAAQQQLIATVRQLSTPLLPVMDGVVVLPLVGHVDTQRAEAITQTLLHGVAEQRARSVILDITGIAAVDTHVIRLLLKAVRATELLGAQVWLVGITAAMAQMIVAQGVDIGQLKTYRDVGSALRGELMALEV